MQLPNLRRFRERYLMPITLALMVAGLVFVYLSPVILVTVPAGHLGVMWHRFGGGTDLDNIVPEGTHLKLPWDRLCVYDARLQVMDQEYDVITKDGLLVHTAISFRFRINREQVGLLHKNVGMNYVNVLLVPEIGDTARVLISEYSAEEFYTTYRNQVRDKILAEMRNTLYKDNTVSPSGVVLVQIDDVMVKSIKLPDSVMTAIENKIQQYQRQLEYAFRVESEKKEAERKDIEGQGVRAMFDRIGARDLASYLRLAGINATLELARSNNAKIVVTGTSGGLPLILGTDTPGQEKTPEAGRKEAPALPNPTTLSLPPAKMPAGGGGR
jgi:prohibitin 2